MGAGIAATAAGFTQGCVSALFFVIPVAAGIQAAQVRSAVFRVIAPVDSSGKHPVGKH